MNSMLDNEWLIPGNLATYDHIAAFDRKNVITWGVTTKIKIGDVVYIYTSASHSRIAYKCIVNKVKVQENERHGDEFWVPPSMFDPLRNQINLRLITKFADDTRLTLHYLKDKQLIKAAPQGPRRLDQNLSVFLNGIA
jgi:hypothetical protein